MTILEYYNSFIAGKFRFKIMNDQDTAICTFGPITEDKMIIISWTIKDKHHEVQKPLEDVITLLKDKEWIII